MPQLQAESEKNELMGYLNVPIHVGPKLPKKNILGIVKSPKILILSFESHHFFLKCNLQVTKNSIFGTWKSQKFYFHALKLAKIEI